MCAKKSYPINSPHTLPRQAVPTRGGYPALSLGRVNPSTTEKRKKEFDVGVLEMSSPCGLDFAGENGVTDARGHQFGRIKAIQKLF